MTDASTASAIRCAGLTRSFENGLAVDDLTLEVPKGSVLALLGHNGAGKTTTIRLLNGVLSPDAGTCEVLGLDPSVDGTELRRRTGVVTENAGLDDRLTARENLRTVARVRGMEHAAATRRIDDLLERFDMTLHADVPCRGFSTGQRRRVALARALLHEPELLFLDEPTSGLDPAGSRAVMDLIETSAREHGRTIVLCTHFLAEAGASADLMAVMHRGRLLEFGRPAELADARWPGLEVTFDLGGRPSVPLVQSLLDHRGVAAVMPTSTGADVMVRDREVVPGVVAFLVARGASVYGTTARPKGLEDVYFALQQELVDGAAAPSAPEPAARPGRHQTRRAA